MDECELVHTRADHRRLTWPSERLRRLAELVTQ
jgi:hypothetical protein